MAYMTPPMRHLRLACSIEPRVTEEADISRRSALREPVVRVVLTKARHAVKNTEAQCTLREPRSGVPSAMRYMASRCSF